MASAAPSRGAEARDIDVFTRKALARIGVVPGLSLAVVHGADPVITAGLGVANVETGAPVDAVELSPLQGEAITFAGPDRLVFEGRTFFRAAR